MTPLLVLLLALTTVDAQTTSGRFGGDPLLGGAGARALALGGAYVALSDDATSVYWNPAGLSHLSHTEIFAQHTEQFGGSVNHDVLALGAISGYGGLGVGIVRVAVDEISLTRLEDENAPLGPENRPEVATRSGSTDWAFYAGFARSFRTRLHVGVSVKIIARDLVIATGTGFGFDLGAKYRLSDNVTLGLTIRDITQTRISFDSGAEDTIRPALLLGAAATRRVSAITGTATASVGLNLNEDDVSSDDARALKIGAEYTHDAGAVLRLGLDGTHFTAGAGYRGGNRFGVDFAFLEHDDLDNTYRLSASLYF